MSRTILITSNEPWGEVWFSKHHYAFELSKLGHQVYFLNPPGKWSVKNLISFRMHTQEISDGLYMVDYKNNLPIRLFPRLIRWFNDLLNSLKLKPLLRKKNEVVFWHFDPFRFIHVFFIPSLRRVYHVVDDFKHLSTDALLSRNCNLVVSVFLCEVDYYRKQNQNVIHIPHGISLNKWKRDSNSANLLEKKYGKFFLVVGTFNDDYDISLLQEIAIRYNYNLVLTGPNKLKDEANRIMFFDLIALDQVHWTGSMPPEDFNNLIACALICLVPYKFGLVTKRSPIKIVHYLYWHKFTISSIATGYESVIEKGFFYAKNKQAFFRQIEQVLAKTFEFKHDEIDEYLKSIRYNSLIEKIFTKLDSVVSSLKN